MSSEVFVTDIDMAIDDRVNRNYKDSVFRMLFRNRDALLSLYNALNGSDYQDPDELEVNTLENAIYLGRKNDVSFLIDSRLNLYEHQSTFNPNMPLRDLFYVSRLYSKITDTMNLYSKRAIKIPFPQFITFYNGMDEQPERQLLRLSDLYPDAGKEFLREASEDDRMFSRLELDVLMININKGHNQELMEQCRLLYEYTVYVDRVREYALKYDLETAVTMAVDHCIRDGILADFLRKCRAEVISMSIFEYNEEEHWRRIEQEEREFGREAGRLEGLEAGRLEGLETGRLEGLETGRREGLEIGKAEGKAEGMLKTLLALLSTKGEISDELSSLIRSQTDPDVLEEWFALALNAKTIDEFAQNIG